MKTQSDELEAKPSNLANTYVTKWPLNHGMKKHGVLKRFHKNYNIVMLRPDKGNCTVIMGRDVYICKIMR